MAATRVVTNALGRALRETGQALDRVGLTVSGKEIFRETFSRHRPIMNLFDKRPLVANGVFVAPSASVVGQVLLYGNSSVWYGAVLRADKNRIQVGSFSNIQDRAVVSTVETLESGLPASVEIGEYVTVGHGAVLTSCTVGNHVLIGQGAIVPEGCVIERHSTIAAGAVLLPDTLVPSGQLWAGNPAKFVRDLTAAEKADLERGAKSYADLSKQHAEEFKPFGLAYQQAQQLLHWEEHGSA